MATIKNGEKYSVKVEYKPEYDETGELNLDAYNQTFSKVKEAATLEQLRQFAVGLMSLTEYADAPYRIRLIDTGELIVE